MGDGKMEKYNKVYVSLWLLFSAITLAFMLMFVLNSLAGMIEADETVENEGLALSFLLLLFTSEVIGFILASLTIDRIPWTYYTHAFFTSVNRRTILYQSF
jgi:inner membrane protein involved in colicin E2 resistance